MSDRFYLVTFDLRNSKGREAEYRQADESLKFRFGRDNFWKIVKQCRIIRTGQDAREIRSTLSQVLGSNCNILVVRLRRGYAFRIVDARDRRVARGLLSQIPS